MTDETSTEHQEQTETKIAPAPRNRWRSEGEMAIVTCHDVTKKFSLSDMPEQSRNHLTFVGFVAVMSRSDDMAAEYAKLQAGDIRERKPATVKVDNWRLAIAHAMVDFTKKSPAPLTLDAAKEKAITLNKDQVKARKTDPKVVTHYNRLAGITTHGVGELLADEAA